MTTRHLILAAAASAAVGAIVAPGAGARAACTAGVRTIGDAPARVFCGPATATVQLGARTYRFAEGACLTGAQFTVNIGTKTFSPSSKLAYFGLVVEGQHDGRYTGKAVLFGFDSGKVHASLSTTRPATVVLHGGLHRGSFAGRDLLGRPLRGSFRC
ncbi:MAG TPA: hypothetical protein VGF23_16390 [Gaiellaceae bacterium]|jgi:hypothetical protein